MKYKSKYMKYVQIFNLYSLQMLVGSLRSYDLFYRHVSWINLIVNFVNLFSFINLVNFVTLWSFMRSYFHEIERSCNKVVDMVASAQFTPYFVLWLQSQVTATSLTPAVNLD